MADMEDVSKFADKTLESAQAFLSKGSSKKEQISLIPSEKIPDSSKAKEELLPNKKLTSLKKEIATFFKGPMRFMLGATVLATGGAGFVVFMPLALIGTGAGALIGWIVKQGFASKGLAQNADRLGAAAGATIGSFGTSILIFSGLKLMADAVPKKDKALSKEKQLASTIVNDAFNQTVSTLTKPTAEQIVNSLIDLIEEDLEKEGINAPTTSLIADELHSKIKHLHQDQNISILYNQVVDPKKQGVFEKPLIEIDPVRLMEIESDLKEILELPNEFHHDAKVIIKNPSESISGKKIEGKNSRYIDEELGIEVNLNQGQILNHEVEESSFKTSSYERLPFVFADLPKETIKNVSIERSVRHKIPSEEVLNGFEGAYLAFLNLVLNENPNYQGKLSEEEARIRLLKEPGLTAILYYDTGTKELTIASFNKNRRLDKTSIEEVKENTVNKIQKLHIQAGYHFIGRTIENQKTTKAINVHDKVGAIQTDAHYHGEMDREAVEAYLLRYPLGSVLTYYDTQKQDIAFAYMSNEGLESRHLFLGENDFEQIRNTLIEDGMLFILNPGEERKAQMEGNAYYQGEMPRAAVDTLLLNYPAGFVVTYYDREQKNIVLATMSKDKSEFLDYPLGNESFEEIKKNLQNEGKLFLLNPEGGDRAQMEDNPYYHGEMTQEEVANRLQENEVMIHYDPEAKRVLMTYWDENGILDHSPIEVEHDFETLKNEFLQTGNILLPKEKKELETVQKAELKAAEFLHRSSQKKVEEYLNKFDKGIMWWQEGQGGKVFFSYKIDGIIKHVDKSVFNQELPKLQENHYRFLRIKDFKEDYS